MKTSAELLAERESRIRTAVALGAPDKVPVFIAADGFCARHMGVTMADYVNDMDLAARTNVGSAVALGNVDAILSPTPNVLSFAAGMFCNTLLPGRELPPDADWQVDEFGPLTRDDYDEILKQGFTKFWMDYIPRKLPSAAADFQRYVTTDFQKNAKYAADAGVVFFSPVNASVGGAQIAMGRGLKNWIKDLFQIPDKMKAVYDMVAEENTEFVRSQIRMAKPLTVFVGARESGQILSPKLWQKFTFPYIQQLVNAVVEEGSLAYLHFDSNWDRDLEYFRELPKGKCIFGCDHATDIYKLKKVLGDHMCILGDVPASTLALGTPDDVYKYCRKLIEEIGPAGFILAAGCSVSSNAPVANVKAMVAAAG